MLPADFSVISCMTLNTLPRWLCTRYVFPKQPPNLKVFIARILYEHASISHEAIKSFILNIIYCPLVVIFCEIFNYFLITQKLGGKKFHNFCKQCICPLSLIPQILIELAKLLPTNSNFPLEVMVLSNVSCYSYRVGKFSETLQVDSCWVIC